jgi:hypothetical protein
LLTEDCYQVTSTGTGPSKQAPGGRGRGKEDSVQSLDPLVGRGRHDAGPVAPIDGSREVDDDGIHLACCCWFCGCNLVRARKRKNLIRALVNLVAGASEILPRQQKPGSDPCEEDQSEAQRITPNLMLSYLLVIKNQKYALNGLFLLVYCFVCFDVAVCRCLLIPGAIAIVKGRTYHYCACNKQYDERNLARVSRQMALLSSMAEGTLEPLGWLYRARDGLSCTTSDSCRSTGWRLAYHTLAGAGFQLSMWKVLCP